MSHKVNQDRPPIQTAKGSDSDCLKYTKLGGKCVLVCVIGWILKFVAFFGVLLGCAYLGIKHLCCQSSNEESQTSDTPMNVFSKAS